MGCCMSSPSKGSGGKNSHTNFEMANLDPLSYIPEASKNRMRNGVVTIVHFVAHSVLKNGGNHWDIFLQTGNNESVRLEIVPGAYPGREGYIGRLDIMEHKYGVTRRRHRLLSIPLDHRRSVANFIDTIAQADNHRYEFTQQGRGCTGWVRDQFYLFVQAGLLPSGWDSEFERAINTAWENNVAQGPWPVTSGTYLRSRMGKQGKGKGKGKGKEKGKGKGKGRK